MIFLINYPTRKNSPQFFYRLLCANTITEWSQDIRVYRKHIPSSVRTVGSMTMTSSKIRIIKTTRTTPNEHPLRNGDGPVPPDIYPKMKKTK